MLCLVICKKIKQLIETTLNDCDFYNYLFYNKLTFYSIYLERVISLVMETLNSTIL